MLYKGYEIQPPHGQGIIILILQTRKWRQRKTYVTYLDHPSSKGQSLNLNPKLTLKPSQPVIPEVVALAQCATHILTFFTDSNLPTQHSSTFTILEPMRNLGRREFIHGM